MRKPRILVVGSLVMDLIVSTSRFPAKGETVIGLDYTTATGGKGANQAVQAARLGAEVTMVGCVGDDDFGRALVQSARNAGVDVSHIRVTKDACSAIGNVQIERAETGTNNRIIVVPGANQCIRPEDVAFLKEGIAGYDMVILQFEIPMAINELVAAYAHEKGVPVMLNTAPSAPVSAELLSHVTYISPNEHEAADITGIAVVDDASARAATAKLRAAGVKYAMITRGSEGAVLDDGETFLSSPCIYCEKVADPTAAGDSFVGAFCTAMCLGVSHEEAMRFANCTAHITVSRMGAQPSLPYLHEVIALMKDKGFDTTHFEQV